MSDFGDGIGGLDGLLPLLLLGGGLGEGRGLSPLLLLLLLGRGFESSSSSSSWSGSSSSSTTSEVAPANFNEFLTANIGRRVKIVLATQTWIIAGQEITARVVAVGSDFVVLDRICVNGVPVLDPRRITVRIATILGVERLTFRDRIVELICALD